MKILNLTQHQATPEQVGSGVAEPADKLRVRALLTFSAIPTKEEMVGKAEELAELALKEGANAAMVGGAPFFMSTLEDALKKRGIRVLYAFSVRESVDQIMENGSIKKVAIFRHVGFVEM